MQKELAELRDQMQQDHRQQIQRATAEAAAANQLIKQGQLPNMQTVKAESIQALAKPPTEGTNWTIEQATASVARVLRVMATSQTD